MKRAACSLAILLAAGVMVSGCQSKPKGPSSTELMQVYLACVKEANNGEAVSFRLTVVNDDPVEFEDFVVKEELTEEQTAQIRECYTEKTAVPAS